MGCQYNFKVGREDGMVEFHVHYEENELYIYQRLEREKRCGKVEKIDDHTSRFMQKFTMRVNWCHGSGLYMSDHRNSFFK